MCVCVDKNTLGKQDLSQKKATKATNIYIPLASFHSLDARASIKEVKVWNYDFIALGKEFMGGDFKGGFAVMREFYISLGRGEKTRNSKPCAWSVDFIVIDLPTGFLLYHFSHKNFVLKLCCLLGDNNVDFNDTPSFR